MPRRIALMRSAKARYRLRPCIIATPKLTLPLIQLKFGAASDRKGSAEGAEIIAISNW